MVVELAGSPDVPAVRLAARTAHFVRAALLANLEILEMIGADEPGVTIDLVAPVDIQVADTARLLTAR